MMDQGMRALTDFSAKFYTFPDLSMMPFHVEFA